MRLFCSTRRFFRSGKNKISILNPCSSYSALICPILYKLAVLGLLGLVTTVLLQRDKQLQPAATPAAARIFCIIVTDDSRLNSVAVHDKRTWTKHCDRTVFVSNDAHEEVEPVVFQHLDDKWLKMRAHLEYVYKYHFDEGDWFLYANDDNFVVVENLRYLLLPHSPNELIYFGCKLRSETNQTYMYGRSAMVLSSATVSQFVLEAMPNETICSSSPQGDAASEQLGRCLSNVNVRAGDSRDHLGYHRFLPFEVNDHMGVPLNKSLELHKNFLDRSYYEVTNSIVKASTTFICSKVEYMPNIYNLYYFTHQVNVFGVPQKIPSIQNNFQKLPHHK